MWRRYFLVFELRLGRDRSDIDSLLCANEMWMFRKLAAIMAVYIYKNLLERLRKDYHMALAFAGYSPVLRERSELDLCPWPTNG